MRRIILLAGIAAIAWGVSVYFKQRQAGPTGNQAGWRYYNLLHEVTLELPDGYQVEDVTYPFGAALFTNLSEEFKRTKSETDFLAAGGIYIKAARQIPGTPEMFNVFREQDFEVKLKSLGKTFTSEPFVTDQGYDAFRTTVTSPQPEVHVVVNAPVAFWFTAQSDASALQQVYQTFKPYTADETVAVKQAVSELESFLTNLKTGAYAAARAQMSTALQSKFTVETLASTFIPAQERLQRPLRVFSVQTNGQHTKVRSTLEDVAQNRYVFVSATLVQESADWKIDLFVFSEDSTGRPYESATKKDDADD